MADLPETSMSSSMKPEAPTEPLNLVPQPSRPTMDNPPEDAWKHSGVQVIAGDQLDTNTAQTPGMNRAAAVTFARTGAQKLWAGTVKIHADAKTGAHHHGMYLVARLKCGVRSPDSVTKNGQLTTPISQAISNL